MKSINTAAAKELVALYRSITADQIKNIINKKDNKYYSLYKALNLITGIGSSKCLLCQQAKEYVCFEENYCIYCIYKTDCGCMENELHSKSFSEIENATTIDQLITAIYKRADHIENILKNIENENSI